VTVEDLLRLKRAERPPSEFWTDFDRQLRAKQLAALVGRRPWWHELNRGLAGIRRYQFPLGAAAVVAITFIALREDRPATRMSPPASRLEEVAATGPAPGAVVSVLVENNAKQLGAEVQLTREVVPAAGLAGGAETSRFTAAGPVEVPGMIPLLGVPPAEAEEPGGTRLPRFVESALIATAAAEPVVSRTLLNTSNRFEGGALPVRPTVEPLQQITPPGERRGARILMAKVSTASVENAMRATERVARRLSEEQLYDQIQRVGARGAGVNVKF
jgi:hypothetical protein